TRFCPRRNHDSSTSSTQGRTFAPGETDFAPSEISRTFQLSSALIISPQAPISSPQTKFPELPGLKSFKFLPQAQLLSLGAKFPDFSSKILPSSFLCK
ncbi:hypothetical protein A2U01_0059383, partial [Trifolium medium]|nr:hypothetical protein [Trifolium medium]